MTSDSFLDFCYLCTFFVYISNFVLCLRFSVHADGSICSQAETEGSCSELSTCIRDGALGEGKPQAATLTDVTEDDLCLSNTVVRPQSEPQPEKTTSAHIETEPTINVVSFYGRKKTCATVPPVEVRPRRSRRLPSRLND